MKAIQFFFISFILFSCSTTENSSNTDQTAENETTATASEQAIESLLENALLQNTVAHSFSNTENDDHFVIAVKGNSISEGTATFTIINSEGNEIFKEEFPAANLTGNDLSVEELSEKAEIDAITQAVAEFFGKERFSSPAIDTESKFNPEDNDNALEAEWTEVRDNQSVGFSFSAGAEARQSIAWAPSLQKVVTIFSCC